MVKRPSSSQRDTSSEYELKPDIDLESDNEIDNDSKTKVSKSPNKKPRKSPLKAKKDSTPREAPRPWVAAEDTIFIEIMSKLLKSKMWEAVKEDGRLGYRGGPGITAHLTSVMNKLKKASGV